MGLVLGQGTSFSETSLMALFTVLTNQKFLRDFHFYIPLNVLQNLMCSVQSILGHYMSTSKYKIRLHMLFYTTLSCSDPFVKHIYK